MLQTQSWLSRHSALGARVLKVRRGHRVQVLSQIVPLPLHFRSSSFPTFCRLLVIFHRLARRAIATAQHFVVLVLADNVLVAAFFQKLTLAHFWI